MDKYKLKNICLSILGGNTHRSIAATFEISPSAVSFYKHRLEYNANLFVDIESFSKLSSMTVDEIVKIIYPNNSEDFFLGSSVIKVNRPKESFFIPDFNEIADKFLESHLTKQFFYCDYLNQCEEKNSKVFLEVIFTQSYVLPLKVRWDQKYICPKLIYMVMSYVLILLEIILNILKMA